MSRFHVPSEIFVSGVKRSSAAAVEDEGNEAKVAANPTSISTSSTTPDIHIQNTLAFRSTTHTHTHIHTHTSSTSSLRLPIQTLRQHHLPIPSPPPHQLCMRPALHHPPPIQHKNTIRPPDSRKPMRHRHRSPPLRRRLQRPLHHLLTLRVQRARRLIQQ